MSRWLLLAAAALPLLASAQAYRWVDDQGHVHYSQVPPPGKNAEPVRPPPPPTSSPNQDSLNKALDDSIKAEPERREQAAKAADAQAQKQQQCQQAREQLAYMDSHPPNRLATTDAQGKVSRVTAEQYAERRAELERAARDACG